MTPDEPQADVLDVCSLLKCLGQERPTLDPVSLLHPDQRRLVEQVCGEGIPLFDAGDHIGLSQDETMRAWQAPQETLARLADPPVE